MQSSTGLLFGGNIPDVDQNVMLSFGFGSMIAEEDFSVNFLRKAIETQTVSDFFEVIDDLGANGWKSFTVNLFMADNGGNIGFQMGVAFPRRKD